jgi:hypothetical protein
LSAGATLTGGLTSVTVMIGFLRLASAKHLFAPHGFATPRTGTEPKVTSTRADRRRCAQVVAIASSTSTFEARRAGPIAATTPARPARARNTTSWTTG